MAQRTAEAATLPESSKPGVGVPPDGELRSGPRRDAALIGVAIALSLLLIANLVDFGYGRDQGIYAIVADAIARGGAPYSAAWDFKPPGIYFVFAAAESLFGPGQRAIRLLEALGLLSLFPAFAIFSRRHVGSVGAGLIGAAIAVLGYVPLGYWNTAQPESFGGVALAWALVCATQKVPTGRRRAALQQWLAWGAAGALYACAALLKPPLGGGILVSAVAIQWKLQRRDSPLPSGHGRIASAAALGLGGALPVATALLYFAAHGALYDLYEALFVFTPRYVSQDFWVARLPELSRVAVRHWLFRMTPFTLMGLIPLLLLPRLGAAERPALAHVLGVSLMSLLGVILQAKFFDYHYGAIVVLTGLMAGWGYWKVWILVRHSAVHCIVALALMACVTLTALPGTGYLTRFGDRSLQRFAALRTPETLTATRDRLYAEGDVDSQSNRLAGQWLRRNTPQGSSLYIWGFQPVIYDLAGRRPASRYIYNVPQRAAWTQAAARELLMRELEAEPPAAVVVIHRDSAVFVTVLRTKVDSSRALADFPELDEMIRTRYRFAVRIGDLEIFTRSGPRS